MLPKIKDLALRAFYMTEAHIQGWSRDIMMMQIYVFFSNNEQNGQLFYESEPLLYDVIHGHQPFPCRDNLNSAERVGYGFLFVKSYYDATLAG